MVGKYPGSKIYITEWEQRFAWFPLRIGEKWVWLQPYERRTHGYIGAEWAYECRLLETP